MYFIPRITLDFSSVGRTITDARSQLSASRPTVENIGILKWGLKAGLV